MKKRPSPVIAPTAFSIARQFTGPPFSVTLESTEIRRHLIEEMQHPATAAKTPGQRREKNPKKTGAG